MDFCARIVRFCTEELWALLCFTSAGFQYESVNTNRPWIRLLKVRSGNASDIIHCSLDHVCLDQNPDFNALSYSWSMSGKKSMGWLQSSLSVTKKGHRRVIICNNRIVRVQRNLYDFLLHYRQQEEDRSRYIWIDALCIDQRNEKEKLLQINLMAKIYGSARAVFVWLGETTWSSHHGLWLIKNLPPFLHEFEYSGNMTEEELFSDDKLNELRFNNGFASLKQILSRVYFERMWVVQEMVLAKQLRIILGSVEITEDELVNAITMFCVVGNLSSQFAKNLPMQFPETGGFEVIPDIIRARKEYQEGNPLAMAKYLSICRERQVTDLRDKVLAVLGLVDEATRLQLNDPSSEKTLTELYIDCARVLANQLSWPGVLSLVGKTEVGYKDLPSWTPDFSVPHKPVSFWEPGHPRFCAATSVTPVLFEVSENKAGDGQMKSWVLNLSAAHFDTISHLGESFDEFELGEVVHLQGRMLKIVTGLGKHYKPTKELTMDAFRRTLVADMLFNRDNEDRSGSPEQDFVKWLYLTFMLARFCQSTRFRRLILRLFLSSKPVLERFKDLIFHTTDLSLAETIEEFVMVHNSEIYEIGHLTEDPTGPPTRPPDKQDPFGYGFTTLVPKIYKDRRLFLTKKGYLGIGPSALVEGDVVMLVAGSAVPFIFRIPADQGRDMQLIGDTYVHGIMEGEALESKDLKFGKWSVG